RLLGYPRDFEIEGGVFALLHPDDVAVAEAAFAEVVAGGRGPRQPVDLRVRAVDGSYRVLETVGVDLRHHPAVSRVVLTSHDVTKERAAVDHMVEATSQLHALVTNLRDGVLFVDDDECIVFANQMGCDLFDLGSPSEIVGSRTSAIRGGCAA